MSASKKRAAQEEAGGEGSSEAKKAARAEVGGGPGLKIVSWNVNGLRAVIKNHREMLLQFVNDEAPDVLILTETKIDDSIVSQFEDLFEGYTAHFCCCTKKKGYSGTLAYSKATPLSVQNGLGIEEHDCEGRLITLEYPDLYVVAAYVPNSGQKLERLEYRTKEWDPALLAHLKELDKKKPVVWTGDLNVAHEEIDLHEPKRNRNKTPGFCDDERENFSSVLASGFVDAWRSRNPEVVQYTYWSIRAKAKATNKGWRLDYFVCSERLMKRVESLPVWSEVEGSDHCPIGLVVGAGG